jgi:hypothetical protein
MGVTDVHNQQCAPNKLKRNVGMAGGQVEDGVVVSKSQSGFGGNFGATHPGYKTEFGIK